MRLDSATAPFLLLKRKSLRRELLAQQGLRDVKIAVLAGSTASEVVDFLELLLLAEGFRPTFWQSDYNRYYEESVLSPMALIAFAPEFVYVHTSYQNIRGFPPLTASAAEFDAEVAAETSRFVEMWTSLTERIGCQIIQNNFELPPIRLLGNLDAVSLGGRTRYVHALNLELAKHSRANKKLQIQDLHGISANLGLRSWFDLHRWYAYKIHTSSEASLLIARSLTAMIRASYGKSKKVLVLDLDNTLWGGVIGDDGVDNIKLGRETPEAESYTAFQEYCLALRNRGVILAVCSKNNEDTAKLGLSHADSTLKLEHFAAFKANWSPKHENILAIAAELNLGVDSFVFVDDNAAERALVAGQLPMVAVPDVGNDVTSFAAIVEMAQYFEPLAISTEDLQRGELYAANSQRLAIQSKFANYGEYLSSLAMVAEIDSFRSEYLDRIAQLTNKTNQFNLTTRRFTHAEVTAMASDPDYLTLYGRLADTFGDNGLITVVVGHREGTGLHLTLWLMSCRVLKRDMEVAVLDVLVQRARQSGIQTLHGYYIKTAKNGMVAAHYETLGFTCESRDPLTENSTWVLPVDSYQPKNRYIEIKE